MGRRRHRLTIQAHSHRLPAPMQVLQALQALLAVPLLLVLQWRLPPLPLAVQARRVCTLPLLLAALPSRYLLQQVRLQGLLPFLQLRLVLLQLL